MAENDENAVQPLSFGEEQASPKFQSHGLKVQSTKVSERDIFRLAKLILIICTGIYVLIAIFKVSLEKEKGIDDVWEYSKVVLNSIISLVLGLYFGQKKNNL
ncbi:MAG: hypothetical protein ACRYFB_01215 [Janthinobacterium lividum]